MNDNITEELPQYAIDAGFSENEYKELQSFWYVMFEKLDSIDTPEKAAALLMIAATSNRYNSIEICYGSHKMSGTSPGTLRALFTNKNYIANKGLELALTKHINPAGLELPHEKLKKSKKALATLAYSYNYNHNNTLSSESAQALSEAMLEISNQIGFIPNKAYEDYTVIEYGLRYTDDYLTKADIDNDEHIIPTLHNITDITTNWINATNNAFANNNGILKTLNNHFHVDDISEIESKLMKFLSNKNLQGYPILLEFYQTTETRLENDAYHL